MAPRKKYDKRILVGNCLDTLKTLDDASISSIVTDPPYELGFMGKTWDASGIAYNVELWRECLRVLKPGGHLLAFGGTRTYHRMAVAIEDAGFEIRDSIQWVYGSGFPKSLDVSKAIDKSKGAKREVTGKHPNPGGTAPRTSMGDGCQPSPDITAPATDAAKQWQGWGTALKPAHEPIVLARKPLTGTVAANVLAHGTGALNIDGCRVGTEGARNNGRKASSAYDTKQQKYGDYGAQQKVDYGMGRWPANIIFDEAAGAELDAQSGTRPTSKPGSVVRRKAAEEYKNNSMGKESRAAGTVAIAYGDEGGAARFFYCPKPSTAERNAGLEGVPTVRHSDRVANDLPGGDNPRNRTNADKTNFHPTVKPLALMRYLVRLVTPPGGTVLDPFLGSGTTAMAAILEGFDWRGCELTTDYLPIIDGRVKWAAKEHKREQPKLPFNEAS
jgi:site-specific DNA-methyltransferase (adenine-specific)